MNTITENLAAALRNMDATLQRDGYHRDHSARMDARAALAAYEAAPVDAEPVRVLVKLEGGLVQAVLCDGRALVHVAVIDYDTEGADDDELTAIPQDGDYAGTTADAVARIETADADPEFIASAFAAINQATTP